MAGLPPPPGWSGSMMSGAPPGPSMPLTAPPPPGYRPTQDPQAAKLEQRKKEWLRTQKSRFGEKKKSGFVEVGHHGSCYHGVRRWSNSRKLIGHGAMQTQKSDMPPEHLRKIVKDIGDVSQKKFSADKRAYLGSLKYMVSNIIPPCLLLPVCRKKAVYAKPCPFMGRSVM